MINLHNSQQNVINEKVDFELAYINREIKISESGEEFQDFEYSDVEEVARKHHYDEVTRAR